MYTQVMPLELHCDISMDVQHTYSVLYKGEESITSMIYCF